MTRILYQEINHCGQCPYAREGKHKGLGTGEYYCHQTYEERPLEDEKRMIPKKYKRIGDQYNYKVSIPDWCPLSVAEDFSPYSGTDSKLQKPRTCLHDNQMGDLILG